MLTAKTPQGRIVSLRVMPLGSMSEQGFVYYGGLKVAYWCMTDSGGNRTLAEALAYADKFIDKHGISIQEDK